LKNQSRQFFCEIFNHLVYSKLEYGILRLKAESSMNPLDVAVLLKIASLKGEEWFQKSLAESLALSQSEISKSLSRSKYAGLLSEDGKVVSKQALLEFLQFGIRYVFPVRPGPLMRGIPTSHSAPPLNKIILSNEAYVWPSAKGPVRGSAIVPLYNNVVIAVERDRVLHELLALVDALRVGRVREKKFAIEELYRRLK
jgi:hypothetical protein